MTYALRTQTIEQTEHEWRSIRAWLNDFVTFNGRDIWLQRPPDDFTRPALNIKRIESPAAMDQGRSLVSNTNDWQIEVLVEDTGSGVGGFWQAEREVSEIKQRLLQSELIPLYLWGWQPPPIEITEIAGGGSLPAAEISVKVTAVNHDDEESLPTDSIALTVALNSSVEVAIRPWPRSASLAKEYKVYAGAVDTETFEVTVAVPNPSIHNVFQIITSLAGGGAALPTTSKMFSHFLRIKNVVTRVLEHPALDSVFNGLVMFRTENQLSRIAVPGGPIEKTIAVVTQDVEVGS